ncbi:MAG TPA: amidohydrolase family protein, partial [Terriglobales bacterium]|nr:amidohydrolase family protein [Terriglobales bacterium]
RWVLPIISPVIQDGAVVIDGSEIAAVGPKTDLVTQFPHADVSEFGNAAILPGFVNAHSHLELTVMRGFLESEEDEFFAWLRKLTLARIAMTGEDLRVSATCGAIEAARAGITCVADSSSLASETVKAIEAVGLRGIVYQESFGPDPKLAKENVGRLLEQIAEARAFESGLVRVGVSPHAPYTVSGPQLELISRIAGDEMLPLMMHAAESEAENLFMQNGAGPFADGLRKRGIEWRAPGTSSIQYLERHGVMNMRPLLAHCVNVNDVDVELIKSSGAAIAHCPKSNAKLGHGRAPFAKFVSSGINTGLGSDSVASNNTCDILEEARFAMLLARLGQHSSDSRLSRGTVLTTEQSLFAATLGGARALNLADQIGALASGMQADIAVVRLNGAHQQPVRNPTDALVLSSSGRDVALTMVAGKEIYRDGMIAALDEHELTERIGEVRRKIEDLPAATRP